MNYERNSKKAYKESDLPIVKSPLNNSAWKNDFNEKIYIRTTKYNG